MMTCRRSKVTEWNLKFCLFLFLSAHVRKYFTRSLSIIYHWEWPIANNGAHVRVYFTRSLSIESTTENGLLPTNGAHVRVYFTRSLSIESITGNGLLPTNGAHVRVYFTRSLSIESTTEHGLLPTNEMVGRFLGEMHRIAFRLMLSSCVCVCVSVCLSVCVYRVCGPQENGLR